MTTPNASVMERAQDAAISTLESYLSAELSTMDTESGSDISFPAPSRVSRYAVIAETDRCVAEVVPTGVRFGVAGSREYQIGRVTCEVTLQVSVFIIRDTLSEQEWSRVASRYIAALLRVLTIRYQELGVPDRVMYCRPGTASIEADSSRDPSGRVAIRAVVTFTVGISEIVS